MRIGELCCVIEPINVQKASFETATGETQPVYIDFGISDLSGGNFYSDRGEQPGAESGAAKLSAREEEMLFRDSGNGSGGILGLKDFSRSSTTNGRTHLGCVVGEDVNKDVKVPSDEAGEAMKALRRMREGHYSATYKANVIERLENGVEKASIN